MMEIARETTIHLDFRLEQRDLFRVYLDLAKLRLCIGVGVVVVFTLGLAWFFATIDEESILLEISPLFIGLPILGVGGQVLRIHAACRKYVSALPESQRYVQYMFQSNTDGYDVTWGGGFSHVMWRDLLKVVEKPNYFLFYLNRFDIKVLPKKGFHQQSDVPLFRGLLLSTLGEKARLLAN